MVEVLKDSDFNSWRMLGNGDPLRMFSNLPFPEIKTSMKYYYLISMAYHVESTIDHPLARPKNDFYEMLMHHTLTILLIGFSWTSGFQQIGVVVMLVMDNADIFVGLV